MRRPLYALQEFLGFFDPGGAIADEAIVFYERVIAWVDEAGRIMRHPRFHG